MFCSAGEALFFGVEPDGGTDETVGCQDRYHRSLILNDKRFSGDRYRLGHRGVEEKLGIPAGCQDS